MIGLSNNKEFLRLSIFFLWLINISGFFGITSDQSEFFLSTTPYVLSLTLLLLLINHDLSDNKSKIGLILIFFLGLIVEILGVNYGFFFGEYSYGANWHVANDVNKRAKRSNIIKTSEMCLITDAIYKHIIHGTTGAALNIVYRHNNDTNVLFVDGHATWMKNPLPLTATSFWTGK